MTSHPFAQCKKTALMVRIGFPKSINCLDEHDDFHIKISNLEFLFPGTVVVHDAHVMVVGLVVHDQADNTWGTKDIRIFANPLIFDKYFLQRPFVLYW